MSAQTIYEAFQPWEASYKAEVMAATWGHLAPKKNKRYNGVVTFAIGNYGSDHLNPTVLHCDWGELPDSPWFFDALADFLGNGQRCSDDESQFKIGCVYRFEGAVRNYQFKGTFRMLLNANPQESVQ